MLTQQQMRRKIRKAKREAEEVYADVISPQAAAELRRAGLRVSSIFVNGTQVHLQMEPVQQRRLSLAAARLMVSTNSY